MQFSAKSLYVHYSPYKLRPLIDVVRGKGVAYALGWLETYKSRRSRPIKKVIESAVANARSLENIDKQELVIKEISVDQGPQQVYFKPGAQGRAMFQRRKMCHIRVILEPKKKKNE